MANVRLRSECVTCLLGKYLTRFLAGYPGEDDRKELEYMQRVLKIFAEAPVDVGGPVISRDIKRPRYTARYRIFMRRLRRPSLGVYGVFILRAFHSPHAIGVGVRLRHAPRLMVFKA